jgi:hypothetical protein
MASQLLSLVTTNQTRDSYQKGGKPLRRTILVLLATVSLFLCGAIQAFADNITYTESATATGTIGGTSFTDALVTITVVGSTSGITGTAGGVFENIGTSGSVTIGGIGTFTLTGIQTAFDSQLFSFAGITDTPPNGEILATSSSVFATYDLTTSVGPISGTAFFGPGPFGTVGGNLILKSLVQDSTTFEATTRAVPEPNTLLLLGASLMGFGVIRRWRH